MVRFVVAVMAVLQLAACLHHTDRKHLTLPEADARLVESRVMRRASFHASAMVDLGLGGHSVAGNSSYFVTAPQEEHRRRPLHITIEGTSTVFAQRRAGLIVALTNVSDEPVQIDATDGLLYVVQQALDVDGVWRDIEYVPSSFCGNSYHSLRLAPGHQWTFLAPRYGGRLKTLLRFKLLARKAYRVTEAIARTGEAYANASEAVVPLGDVEAEANIDAKSDAFDKACAAVGKLDAFYSEPFAGAIEPTQFTDREGHTRTGIMDPYLD